VDWTPYQRERIILRYAHEGVAFCPDDQEPLIVVLERAANSNQRVVNLRCPSCGKELGNTAEIWRYERVEKVA
jgi:predicted RNA-binding Zn-ribbon protein involved in translation (DUF1610 family)